MKLMNVVKKYGPKVATGTAALVAAGSALATGPDYSSLTAAADWSSVSTGIITIGAAVMAVVVVLTGVGMLLRAGKK